MFKFTTGEGSIHNWIDQAITIQNSLNCPVQFTFGTVTLTVTNKTTKRSLLKYFYSTKSMYTAYVLSKATRDYLAEMYPPKYSKFIGHHITEKFGVDKYTIPPQRVKTAEIFSYVDSGDGLETFIVRINENFYRPDGNWYHITWSLDPDIYKPVDSNNLIKNREDFKFSTEQLLGNIPIVVEPALLK